MNSTLGLAAGRLTVVLDAVDVEPEAEPGEDDPELEQAATRTVIATAATIPRRRLDECFGVMG
jgi:hypothetical protein